MDIKDNRISQLENSERTLKAENVKLQSKVRELEQKTSQLQTEIDSQKAKLRRLSL